MKCYCVQCLKSFEGRNIAQEFCSTACRSAFHKAETAHRTATREALRDHSILLNGARVLTGGRQAINFGLSDTRKR